MYTHTHTHTHIYMCVCVCVCVCVCGRACTRLAFSLVSFLSFVLSFFLLCLSDKVVSTYPFHLVPISLSKHVIAISFFLSFFLSFLFIWLGSPSYLSHSVHMSLSQHVIVFLSFFLSSVCVCVCVCVCMSSSKGKDSNMFLGKKNEYDKKWIFITSPRGYNWVFCLTFQKDYFKWQIPLESEKDRAHETLLYEQQ